jgi:hypothetical protein
LTIIVIGLFATSNERLTSDAAANDESPPCDAVIVHVPADTIVTETFDTVHTLTVDDPNATGSCDDAVAATVKSNSPYVLAVNGSKVMVWLINPAVTVCVTWGATRKFVFPAWLAAITHVPDVAKVTTPLAREHTLPAPVVIVNDTDKPDVDVAVGVKVEPATAFDGAEVNVIAWAALETAIDRFDAAEIAK